MRKIDVQEGQVFGRLTVVSEITGAKRRRFLLRCSCGGSANVLLTHLIDAQQKSCGCLRREASRNREKDSQATDKNLKAIATKKEYLIPSRVFLVYQGAAVPIETASALSGVRRTTLFYRRQRGLTELTGLFEPVKVSPKADKKPPAALIQRKPSSGLKEPTGFFKPTKVALKPNAGYWSL